MPIPVHIVGGFLGTGKTTLIRDQIGARRGEQLAILVNDFGEAALDEATLAGDRPYEITNIPGGCVCCTAPEGFVDALGALVERAPDRVLIEPTGLARPQDLVDTIRRSPHAAALEIAPVVVLIDPARLDAASEQEQELIAHQAEIADLLVANRTDLCGPEQLDRFDRWVAGLWPGPLAVHRTTHGRIPPELMEWPEGEGARILSLTGTPVSRAPAATDHDSTHGYQARSWLWPPDRIFSRERLLRAILRLQQGLAGVPLVRFKGIFRTDEGFLHLEIAGEQLHEARSLHRRDSRADAIFARGESEPFERAAGWLQATILSPREMEARRHEVELVLPDGRVRIVSRAALEELPDAVADVSLLFPKRRGVAARLAALWKELGLPEQGSAVVCAADGFTSEPLPIEALREGLLLHGLDGGPLPDRQGGPFRLLIPDGVPSTPPGCANVKGVVRIVLKGEAPG